MFGRLLWKDLLTIRSLLLAVGIGIVVANLVLAFIWKGYEVTHYVGRPELVEWSIAFWILMPNLIALGAPAMLVGNEEESGTLRWLRTLPIPWQSIADAKVLVGLVCLLIFWLASSTALLLISLMWGEGAIARAGYLFSWSGLAIVTFFSCALQLLGFVFVYMIRAPLVAMFTLIPTYFVFLITMGNNSRFFFDRNTQTLTQPGILVGICILFLVWVCQRLLARRRLYSPISTTVLASSQPLLTSDYQPPILRVGMQPSPVNSLLWQQTRQSGPLCLTLLLVSTFLSVMFCLTTSGLVRRIGVIHLLFGMAPLFVLLSASWLGAVVFYGDNVRRRCGFFADRGIAPAQIWWTRMLPPAIVFLVTWILVGIINLSLSPDTWGELSSGGFLNATLLAAVMFSFGQLVSQWSDRPLLAFMAAPAYTFISLTPLIYLLEYYRFDFAVIALTIPFLLLATRQLTGRWLEGGNRSRYTWHVLAYTAVAVLVPCLWILGSVSIRSVATSTTPTLTPTPTPTRLVVSVDPSSTPLVLTSEAP